MFRDEETIEQDIISPVGSEIIFWFYISYNAN